MQKSHTALFTASILALGILGYGLAPGAANPSGEGDRALQQNSERVEDCAGVAIDGSEGCLRGEDTASVYGQLHNADGSVTVWSLTFSEQADAKVRRYRDLLLTEEGNLEYETVITVEDGPEGRSELREVFDAEGKTVFRELRRSGSEAGVTEVEQMPIAGDPEQVIAILQRATGTLQQALALSPSV